MRAHLRTSTKVVETFRLVVSYTRVNMRSAMKQMNRPSLNPAFKRFQTLPQWSIDLRAASALPAPRFQSNMQVISSLAGVSPAQMQTAGLVTANHGAQSRAIAE